MKDPSDMQTQPSPQTQTRAMFERSILPALGAQWRRRSIACGALLLVLLTLAGPAAAQQGHQGSYKIAAGDILDVVVWRNKDLSLTVVVRPDGFISFPLLSDVQAAGLTPVELARKVETGLSPSVTSPVVTILVNKVAGIRVSILGKVRQPGRYEVEASATALDVLALAGGPNDYAQSSGIFVLRRNGSGGFDEIPVKFSNSEGKNNSVVPIKYGDVVMVP